MQKQTYYMNKNVQEDSGDYEVHANGCTHGADESSKLYLGEHYICSPAVDEAIRLYGDQVTKLGGRVNGCYWCCNSCHTG